MTLSALNAFRIRLEQISIVYERNFPRNTKGSHYSRTILKNIRVRRCRRSLPSLLLLLSRKVVRLSFTYDAEITFGETSSEFSSKEKSVVLCCVVSVVVSQTVAAFDTKNKEERKRARVLQRALSYLRLSRVFAGASFCFREEYSIGAFDSSREADARRACWNAEKRIRFLCADDDEDAIFGTIHPRSGNFDDDFDE